MKQFYMIILESNANSTLIRKIKELGNYRRIYDNQYIVCADYGTAHHLYEVLFPEGTTPDFGFVIFSVPVNSIKFWGYSDTELWLWLSKQISQVQNELI